MRWLSVQSSQCVLWGCAFEVFKIQIEQSQIKYLQRVYSGVQKVVVAVVTCPLAHDSPLSFVIN